MYFGLGAEPFKAGKILLIQTPIDSHLNLRVVEFLKSETQTRSSLLSRGDTD
jgi:hypothetical protein